MDPAETRAFLERGTRTGKLAVLRPDGSPHVVPIWFVVDGPNEDIVFMTGATTVKGRALRRDPRVSLCVDDEAPPFSFVRVDGTAVLSEESEERLRWSLRYMGPEQAEEYEPGRAGLTRPRSARSRRRSRRGPPAQHVMPFRRDDVERLACEGWPGRRERGSGAQSSST